MDITELNDLFKNKRMLNISNLMNDYDCAIIYGAGNCGRDVYKLFSHIGFPVRCFADQKSDELREYKGVSIVKADDIPLTLRKNGLTVIAVYNPYTDILPIMSYLENLGYSNIITFVELYLMCPEFFGDRQWLTSSSFYKSFADAILETSTMWHDDFSTALYKSVIQFRFTGDYSILPPPQIVGQYSPNDIPGWKIPRRFIDCGAYTGDTLVDIYTRCGQIEAIAAFEPDIDNYKKLCRECRAPGRTLAKELYLFPCGVWSAAEQLKFRSGQEEASNISSDGSTIIQCISLDYALYGFRPTYIKMDIEGAEYEALKGAKEMICDEHPQLAVCLYHRPDDLWRIPLLLKEWNLDYRFYLRLHKYNCSELVLYAI
jgi:FkbM family methyltransferase